MTNSVKGMKKNKYTDFLYTLKEQSTSFQFLVDHLKTSKKLLEDLSGQEVISFRAPALRLNGYTPLALTEVGFKIDSSVASQRFDLFFSYGGRQKDKSSALP